MEGQWDTCSSLPNPIKNFYCRSRFPQYFSAFVVNLSVLSVGTVISWPATAIPDINVNATFPPLSSQQVAWIISSASLGGLAACPLAGYFIQRLGLRRSMLILTLPLLLGWSILIFSNGFWTLLLGRIITGFCSGGMSLASPAFIAETSDLEIRGMLGYAFDIMCAFGQLYIFVVGAFATWRWQAFACGIIPIIFYFLMMVIPESPRILISKNKLEEAKKSLAWFRHASSFDHIEEEFNSICQELSSSTLERSKFKFRDCFSTQIVHPTLICVVLMFFYNASGSSPVFSYTVEIFKSAHVNNSFQATILVGLTQVVVASTSAFFVDSFGRRVLLMISTIGMTVSLSILSGYLHLESNVESGWTWLPIPCLMLYVVLFSIGMGPIPWVLMGEVIPSGVKGYTSAIIIGSYRVSTFLVLYTFNDLVTFSGGMDLCFLLFAAASFLGFVFVYFFVPETKQKTLEEVQILFGKNRNSIRYVQIP